MNRPRNKSRSRSGGGSSKRRSGQRRGGKNGAPAKPLKSTDLVPEHSGAQPSKNPAHYDPDLKIKSIFFDTFANAKQNRDKIKEACETCGQLNVVIKAEGNMQDPEILEIHENVKIYAGEAWTLIHNRRLEESWYS